MVYRKQMIFKHLNRLIVLFYVYIILYLPKRNSPKLPQPIFLPTRKFGPTISTPVVVLTDWRVEYMLLLELLPPARAVVAFATLPADGPAVVVCGPPPLQRKRTEID